jgi:tRNA(adenine34) deaminase
VGGHLAPVISGAVAVPASVATLLSDPMGPEGELFDAWMTTALGEARHAAEHDDVPVGALVVSTVTGDVVAQRHNERERAGDPTAHAEVLALRDAAAAIGDWRLTGHALVVTLEPCPMCAGAAWAARVPLIVFGAADPRAGSVGTLYNFAADPRLNHAARVVSGIRAEECGALLEDFFATRR